MMTIDDIQAFVRRDALRWTNHITVRLLQRGIAADDVECALLKGEIIERYPNDYPYPSCLVVGAGVKGETLHVVCGSNDENLWLITAYRPTPEEWMDDLKTRRRESL